MTRAGTESQAVREAYRSRAAEYIEALGAIGAMSPLDQAAIEEWSRGIDGHVVDAGCGPGHWTAHLHTLGVNIKGIDMVPAFIDSARRRFPDVTFRLGELECLPVESASLGGIMAWYSVIHVPPESLPAIIREFSRCLAPDGSLLLGFFEGRQVEPFDHVVTTAYSWSVGAMAQLLEDAAFEVLDVQTRSSPGARPHAAMSARLSE